MTDYSELKRLAEDAIQHSEKIGEHDWYHENEVRSLLLSSTEDAQFVSNARPEVVLALIAENETLQSAARTLEHLRYTDNGGELWKPPIGKNPDFELIDQLKAELAGLRTGFDAQNEVIAGLKAQIDAFRRSVSWAVRVHRDPELSHEIPNSEWIDDLEVAMGKGGEA